MLKPPDYKDYKLNFDDFTLGDSFFDTIANESFVLIGKRREICTPDKCDLFRTHSIHQYLQLADSEGVIQTKNNSPYLRYNTYTGFSSPSIGDGFWVWNPLTEKSDLATIVNITEDSECYYIYVRDNSEYRHVTKHLLRKYFEKNTLRYSLSGKIIPLQMKEYSDAATTLDELLAIPFYTF